ncbi:CotZ-related putative spore coat protein [Bacillus sp. Bos-x628]|uniref:CotZ-related putative spore coat protein n=1 Tax=Bacillus maqinnsis TaxID=3229854 RepID=UPI00338D5E69
MSRLKEKKNKTKDERFAHKCSVDFPFFLMTKDGAPFYSWVFSENNMFKTCFFSLISINEDHNCVLLELLVPCCARPACCQKVLYRSSSRILMDVSFLCGISEVELPVYDDLILRNIETHRIPLCFSTSSSSFEIWRNETKLRNTATVVLHHQGDQDVPISIRIQTKKTSHHVCVKKGESRAITVEDILYISKEESTENVQALLDIQLNMVRRKKIKL